MKFSKTLLTVVIAASLSACELEDIGDGLDKGLNGVGDGMISVGKELGRVQGNVSTVIFGDKTYTATTTMVMVDGVETEQTAYEPIEDDVPTVVINTPEEAPIVEPTKPVVFLPTYIDQTPVKPEPTKPVVMVKPEPIFEPEPVVIYVPVVVEPTPEPVIIIPPKPEPKPEPIVEPEPTPEPVVIVPVEDEPIDPDGETIFTIVPVSGNWTPNPNSWVDSYSVGNRCYIYSTFDHGAGDLEVETPYGIRTVSQVAQLIGEGPGIEGNPRYNDIQCGNGPANDFGDEDFDQCPGRVDQGKNGCGIIGPRWYFDE